MNVPGAGEPALGSDPEAAHGPAMLVGVSWVPVAGLRGDVQVRLVLDALPAPAEPPAKAP